MGLRFRKKIKVSKGVHVNLNKKSVGISFGTKGFRHTINTKGRKTTTVSAPGTGLSYSFTSGSSTKSSKPESNREKSSAKPVSTKTADTPKESRPMASEDYKGIAFILAFLGIFALVAGLITGTTSTIFCSVIAMVGAVICFLMSKFGSKDRAYMLAWQSVIAPSCPTDKLIMNENQLIRETNRQLRDDAKIINDCSRLINETIKPDVFFLRISLLEEKLHHFDSLVPFSGDEATGESVSRERALVEDKQTTVKQFICRYYESVENKANTMKTEKGRLNQYKKFYDSLQKYTELMNDDNVQLVEYSLHQFSNKLNI